MIMIGKIIDMFKESYLFQNMILWSINMLCLMKQSSLEAEVEAEDLEKNNVFLSAKTN